MARRDDRGYREYLREEQRSQPGCPARKAPHKWRGQATNHSFDAALREDLRAVRFVYLKAGDQTLARRLADRGGHFAGPVLLASQLADLEEPADALTVDATEPPDRIVAIIRREFGL